MEEPINPCPDYEIVSPSTFEARHWAGIMYRRAQKWRSIAFKAAMEKRKLRGRALRAEKALKQANAERSAWKRWCKIAENEREEAERYIEELEPTKHNKWPWGLFQRALKAERKCRYIGEHRAKWRESAERLWVENTRLKALNAELVEALELIESEPFSWYPQEVRRKIATALAKVGKDSAPEPRAGDANRWGSWDIGVNKETSVDRLD